MFCPQLFPAKYFGAPVAGGTPSGFQPLLLSQAVLDAVLTAQAECPNKMGGFHPGMPAPEGMDEPKRIGALMFTRSKPVPGDDKKEKGVCLVENFLTGQALFIFGRMAMTNMGRCDVTLSGIRISCSEQLFQLYKASSLSSDPAFEEVTKKILLAGKPFETKKVVRDLTTFDAGKWSAICKTAMFQSLQIRALDPSFFGMLQAVQAKAGDVPVLFVEANDDSIWGINLFTHAVADKLEAGLPDFDDLFESAAQFFEGTNFLGEVMTDFANTIKGLSHEAYLDAMRGVEWVKAF